MGVAKNNPTAVTVRGRGKFDNSYVARCEADSCLHHSVAFERVTGWPVHAALVGDTVLRLHVEDSSTWVFDVRGILHQMVYDTIVIQPIASARSWPAAAVQDGQLKIGTRCCGEDGLAALGLSTDEVKLAEHEATIRSNRAYLACVPERPFPRLPASAVARYSWSGCVVYAEAVSRLTGLPAATMRPTTLVPGIELLNAGIHAVVLHPDGEVEDVWGKQAPDKVASRYGMARWTLNREEHNGMIAEALRVRPTAEADIDAAIEVVRSHRRLPAR